MSEIDDFLLSEKVARLQLSIEERAYIVLWGDGLFVHVAKRAHQDDIPIFGINFGTKGFLLHEKSILENENLAFDSQEYPILHAEVRIGDEQIDGYAFNEVYLTRAGDASSVHLSFAQRGKIIERYLGDGLMISTPAGSTGWSRSYGGVVLPNDANLNVLTPLGKIAPREFSATVLPDRGRIHIKNDTTREAPIDILVDNRRIVSMESRPFELMIERASRWVRLLIEQSYRKRWDAKIYTEQGMALEE